MLLHLRIVLIVLTMAAVLFGCAGRLDLPFFWAYVAMTLVAFGLILNILDPDLIKERVRPGAGGVDRNLRFMAAPFMLLQLVVAGLDARFGWSAEIPVGLRIAAFVASGLGLGLAVWSMAVNRFFSPVVRIQSERGHRLVTAGPYAVVRHPGYVASIGAIPLGSIVLGSWWSLLAIAPAAVLVLRRTIIEDRYLLEHLDGYADYARRVRYRLLPGIW